MGVAWKVTPEVGKFDEAIDWLSKRTVLTAIDARKLDDAHKIDAFWVGGGLELTQVQRVFDKIQKAVENGESFDEWRKGVLGELRNDAHAETVFRNATQRAYTAGRWEQMREPNTLRFRPFWLVDAILDSRTTEYCKQCNGTLQPADSEYWLTHYFPAHHRCRTCVRCLTAREAERRGGLKAPPEGLEPAKGFGLAPTKAEQWKPDPKKHDEQLLLDFGDKAAVGTLKRKPRKPPAPKPKLDTETWVKEYEPRYGADAAKSLAHGRAALELGLDTPVKEVRRQLRKLDAPGISSMLDACEDCDAGRTLREQAGELDPLRKAAAALTGHLRTLPKRAAITHPGLAKDAEGAKALEFFTKLSGKGVRSLPPSYKAIRSTTVHPHFDPDAKHIYFDAEPGSLHHEFAHTIEWFTPGLALRAEAFLKARAKGTALVSHGSNGHCWDDDFYFFYTGRRYPRAAEVPGTPKDLDAPLVATELLSTGSELLFAGELRWGNLEEWMKEDAEHLLFVLGQLASP